MDNLISIVIFIDESDSLRLIYNTGTIEDHTAHEDNGSHVQSEIPETSQSERSLILQVSPPLFNLLPQVPAYPYESPCKFYCTCLDKVPSILEKSRGDFGQNISNITWSRGQIDTILGGLETFEANPNGLQDASRIDSASLLRDQEQSYLLRYFIDVLSSWVR